MQTSFIHKEQKKLQLIKIFAGYSLVYTSVEIRMAAPNAGGIEFGLHRRPSGDQFHPPGCLNFFFR